MTTTTTRPPPRPSSDGPRASRPADEARSEPTFLTEFRRLRALAPPGAWPATLPTEAQASLDPKPLALGIGERVAALLPESERPAFHLALGRGTDDGERDHAAPCGFGGRCCFSSRSARVSSAAVAEARCSSETGPTGVLPSSDQRTAPSAESASR